MQSELEHIGVLGLDAYKAWDAFMRAIRFVNEGTSLESYEPERLAFLAAESKFKEACKKYLEKPQMGF